MTPGLNLTLDANLTELVSSCDEEEGLVLEVATGNGLIRKLVRERELKIEGLRERELKRESLN